MRMASNVAQLWRRVSVDQGRLCCVAALLLIASVLTLSGQANASRAPQRAIREATVGFQTRSIPNGGEPPLRVGIWYPAVGRARNQTLEDFTQLVSPDAKVSGKGLPLVLISHGGGGSLASHFDTALALARAGFVVAAVDHAGDMVRDQTKVLQLWRRPQQLSRVVTYMLTGWSAHTTIDPRRVGAYGFSNGGFTVLVAAGGVPNLALVDPYCRANPTQDLCAALLQAGVTSVASMPVPRDAWKKDKRIRAIAVAAPGFAPTLADGGLRNIRLPVQLWYGSDDRHQPGPWYGELILRELPNRPELHVVRGAGHYDFLAPCSPTLARAVPLICTEAGGFDRAAFHRDLNDGLIRFFRRQLRKH